MYNIIYHTLIAMPHHIKHIVCYFDDVFENECTDDWPDPKNDEVVLIDFSGTTVRQSHRVSRIHHHAGVSEHYFNQ